MEDTDKIITAAQLKQKDHEYDNELINGTKKKWAEIKKSPSRIEQIYNFMKSLSTRNGKPFPEESFENFFQGIKLFGDKLSLEDYKQKLRVYIKNPADFPSKLRPPAGIPEDMISLMASMEMAKDNGATPADLMAAMSLDGSGRGGTGRVSGAARSTDATSSAAAKPTRGGKPNAGAGK